MSTIVQRNPERLISLEFLSCHDLIEPNDISGRMLSRLKISISLVGHMEIIKL